MRAPSWHGVLRAPAVTPDLPPRHCGVDRRRLAPCAASAPMAICATSSSSPPSSASSASARPSSSSPAASTCRSRAIVTVSGDRSCRSVAALADPTGAAAILATLAALDRASASSTGSAIAFLRVHPLIMTLAMATFLQGLLILIAGGSAISTSQPARRLARQCAAVRHAGRRSCLDRGRRRCPVPCCTGRAGRLASSPSAPIRRASRCPACRSRATTLAAYAHQRLHAASPASCCSA